jgi:two-component SAPR family response regulator
VKNNRAEIAFLDINMRGMGGLALAEKILAFQPECKIIFCTGYEEYAIPAFKLHASGYLLKPISAEDVQGEIDNIKGLRQKERVLTVKCFGNFEVYAKNETLIFKRLKTKELFAFLVDRNGAGMTAKQICAVLFPNDTDDNKNSAYLRQLVLDLKNTLKSVGAEGVLRHETPCYRIDTNLLKCDYISYLESGKPEFFGEYMTQYSWAEETCAMLQYKK